MSTYTRFWKKHRFLRTLFAACLLLLFPVWVTIALWVEYWESDVKSGFFELLKTVVDWRTK